MTDTSDGQYQVQPEEPDAPTWREATEKFSWSTVGCLVPVSLVGTMFIVDVVGELTGHRTSEMNEWLPAIVTNWGFLFILGTLWAYLSHVRGGKKRKAGVWRSRLDAKKKEARGLTARAADALASSAELAPKLPAGLEAAKGWLQKAEEEFQERAFGPFWDAIEKAACNLEDFRRRAATIRQDADTFYKALEGRRHSFPSFCPRPEAIADPTPVLEDLRRLVRKGQTDFQFANIWEHRRTREVLIAGFRTLEDGISNLGDAVCSAMSDLQSTLSSGLAEIVEQQISSRETVEEQGEEQIRMLDDIRRGEKPWW